MPSAREDKRFDKIRLFEYLANETNPLSIAIDKLPSVSRQRLLAFFREPQTLEGKFVFLKDLIDSDADADRIDFLNRDAYHANGPVGTVDHNTLIENARPFVTKLGGLGKIGYKLTYKPEAAQTVHNLLDLRDAMYAKVYEHDVKTAAEEMLCHAIYAFYRGYSLDENDLEQILRLSDGDLISIIRLFGQEYERKTLDKILDRRTHFVAEHFRIPESPKPNSFEEKIFELARQLKSTGFEEKVRIERILSKDFLSLDIEFPAVFIRPPEILSVKKTSEEIAREKSKKAYILVDGKAIALEDHLRVSPSESPELRNLRIYAPLSLKSNKEAIIEAFKKFIEAKAWKP